MIANLFKSKDEIAEVKLRSYVDFVKSILVDSQCNVLFYIMGGSVFSTLKGLNQFDDIDVFFSNSEDAEAAIGAVERHFLAIDKVNYPNLKLSQPLGTFSSLNALSFIWTHANRAQPPHTGVKIQFIRKTVGTVQEIFNAFDLNTSRCCITSEYDIKTNVTLNEDIKIIFKNFRSNTPERYFKYINEKKCTDKGATQLYETIDYLIDNFYIKIEDLMYDKYEALGYNLIFKIFSESVLPHPGADWVFHNKHLFEKMCTKFEKDELIQAFTDLNFIFNPEIMDSCAGGAEYAVFDLLNKKSNMVTLENIKLAHELYPEYFI